MEDPLRSQGSFLDSSRLYTLQGALAQQEWRVGSLLHRLDTFLRPALNHPFQNVRERLGSVLANIYAMDIEFPSGPGGTLSPRLSVLLEEVTPGLQLMTQDPDPELYNFHKSSGPPELSDEAFQKVLGHLEPGLASKVRVQGRVGLNAALARSGPARAGGPRLPGGPTAQLLQAAVAAGAGRLSGPLLAAVAEARAGAAASTGGAAWEERQTGGRLLQTLCKLVAGVLLRNWYTVKPELFCLLEMLALNCDSELEPDLASDCNTALACLATAILPPDLLTQAMQAVYTVAELASWKARVAMLEFTQVCQNSVVKIL